MNKIEIKVEEKYTNLRLDKYLSKVKEDFSRSHIQQLIKEGFIEVNGVKEKKSYKVETGDHIIIKEKEPQKLDLKEKEMDLDIIYEDDEIILINKPAGLLVHPVKGNRTNTLVNALLSHSEKLGNINGTIRPGIVHRLDKNTSGAIVVAKTQKSLVNLQKQFKQRKTKKIYRTILKGTLPYNSGTIDAPIGRNPKNRTKMAVVKENSKNAVTEFKVLLRSQGYTYVEVSLKTGRTHQIRVHFSHIDYPIIGDQKYGSKEKNEFSLTHHLLHSYQLGFFHPSHENWVEYNAELPTNFKQVLSKIKE
ncbi:MAG: RluA family pseudouridine synthase [Halanaerobiales bacterium]|nr:RluA family pseudouridine synthase [Halanaerobiales bacterium]